MKSSTLRRSNLSKEKMAVLEALSNYRQDSYDDSPNVYVRPNKEKELDVLWQNFKISQKSEKSPSVYLATGFIVGAVTMLVVSTLISFSVNGISLAQNNAAPVKTKVKTEKLNLLPASEKAAATNAITGETYTVQSGDTMESIMVRFYGSSSPSKIEAVKKANGLNNINRLSIGQKLNMPTAQ